MGTGVGFLALAGAVAQLAEVVVGLSQLAPSLRSQLRQRV
jgi:hypothetical protein